MLQFVYKGVILYGTKRFLLHINQLKLGTQMRREGNKNMRQVIIIIMYQMQIQLLLDLCQNNNAKNNNAY